MKRKQGQILTAVLVDYDNIYLALRRKSEEAARRFAKDAGHWLKEIESGHLITPTNSLFGNVNRRIVLNRCYGNPVPRRNTHDNSTDMNSFPFVRHYFLRSGFEVVDCPPLTAQLKNSSDIRMVMDVRDFLLHETYFDEFIILSGDADFTPVLHRLRAHARRTVIFANDHTAVPYKAIADGEIRESDLIKVLVEGAQPAAETTIEAAPPVARLEDQRRIILDEVLAAVRASRHPIPVELLAERAVKLLGADKTISSGWAGAGSLRELLKQASEEGIRIGEQAPHFVFDLSRRIEDRSPAPQLSLPQVAPVLAPAAEPTFTMTSLGASTLNGSSRAHDAGAEIEPPTEAATAAAQSTRAEPQLPLTPSFDAAFRPIGPAHAAVPTQPATQYARPQSPMAASPPPQAESRMSFPPQLPSFEPATTQPLPQQAPHQPRQGFDFRGSMPPPFAPQASVPPAQPKMSPRTPDPITANALQQSIARIHEACQAPPLSPPEYRVLFDVMAREIMEKGLAGAQTLTNIVQRAHDQGVEIRKDDVRFVLEVVSESDPWFEQGASATLFAGRFRNFVVARCRSQGLHLSADELDLIEAWFVAGTPPSSATQAQQPYSPPVPAQPAQAFPYGQAYGGAPMPAVASPSANLDEEFPRIVRTRLRG